MAIEKATSLPAWPVLSAASSGSGIAFGDTMRTAGTHLAVYLNDHLGSAAASLRVLDLLEANDDDELRDFVIVLRQAISQDRDQLARLMTNAGVTIGNGRRPKGWTMDKAAESRLNAEDAAHHGLKTFELLEMLALNVDGKRALWSLLRIVSTDLPSLRADYARLSQRADDQRAAVETRRLEWAAKAFSEDTR
jgi:hypothetical protein